jgi:hypothetical protein
VALFFLAARVGTVDEILLNGRCTARLKIAWVSVNEVPAGARSTPTTLSS